MKISIVYDENKNVFLVQFDRATTQDDGWPPPPPWTNQIQELGSWLVKMYPECLDKFKDQKISGLTYEFQPSPGQK